MARAGVRSCLTRTAVLWACCCATLPRLTSSSAPFFKLAAADSLTQVRRDWLPQQQAACSAFGMSIDMAQNEFESAQLVVFVPRDRSDGVYNVTWSISELVENATGATIPPADVTVAPLGFVFGGPCPFDSHNAACPESAPWYCKYGNDHNNSEPGPDTCMARLQTLRCVGCAASPAHPLRQNTMPYDDPLGWWPFPVLDWVDSFDVARGTAQPLLVTVRSRTDTKPGTYKATINVTEHGACRTDGGCGRPVSMPLSVTVHPVALPEVHSPETLSFWGVEISEWAGAHPGRPCNDSKFTDLLLDHRLPSASGIYHGMWSSYGSDSGGGASHPDHYPSGLNDLWERGQRAVVLEGLTDCQGGLNKIGCMLEYRIAQVKALAARATAQGWSQENLFVYIFDEVGPSSVNAVGRILSSRVKAVCPKCQVVACGSAVFNMLAADPTVYEKGHGGALELVDVFIPRLADYANASKTLLATLRAAGKRVGWYVSGAPAGDYALNFFVEYPAIRPRLLAGFVAHKFKSDALLYYAMNGWASYGKGVPYDLDAVSSTLNVTYFRNVNATYDGEGQLVVPAPATSRCAQALTFVPPCPSRAATAADAT